MTIHNIGFYDNNEDLKKIIFELHVSSNNIKYASYFFCCSHSSDVVLCCLFWCRGFGDVSPYVCSLYFEFGLGC